MNTFSFSKNQRIRKRSEFLFLSESGKKIRDRYFIVICLPGGGPASRLGITASKRVGNAVARNRIKRRVREFFRLNHHRIDSPFDINIIATKESARLTSHQVDESLQGLFDRLEGIRP